MIKKILLLGISFMAGTQLRAQELEEYPQLDTTVLSARPLLNLPKETFVKNVKLIANTRFGYRTNFTDGAFTDGRFTMDEFRLEAVGMITRTLKFRYRDMFTHRSSETSNVDNLRHTVDIAMVEMTVSPRFSIAAGRLPTNWGSFEFDSNPIYIYGFNNMLQYGNHFVSGAQVKWRISDDHALAAQLLNPRNESFNRAFGGSIPEGVSGVKAPISTVLTWKGHFMENRVNTIWSYNFVNEARNKYVNYFALGNQYTNKKNFTIEYDFKWSDEQFDRTGMVSRMIAGVESQRALDVRYVEHWLRAQYFFAEKWSGMLTGMVSTDYWYGERAEPIATPKSDFLRDTYSLIASVEYHVYKPYQFKVFVAYVGRYFRNSTYAKERFGPNFNTGIIMVGMASPLVFI